MANTIDAAGRFIQTNLPQEEDHKINTARFSSDTQEAAWSLGQDKRLTDKVSSDLIEATAT